MYMHVPMNKTVNLEAIHRLVMGMPHAGQQVLALCRVFGMQVAVCVSFVDHRAKSMSFRRRNLSISTDRKEATVYCAH